MMLRQAGSGQLFPTPEELAVREAILHKRALARERRARAAAAALPTPPPCEGDVSPPPPPPAPPSGTSDGVVDHLQARLQQSVRLTPPNSAAIRTVKKCPPVQRSVPLPDDDDDQPAFLLPVPEEIKRPWYLTTDAARASPVQHRNNAESPLVPGEVSRPRNLTADAGPSSAEPGRCAEAPLILPVPEEVKRPRYLTSAAELTPAPQDQFIEILLVLPVAEEHQTPPSNASAPEVLPVLGQGVSGAEDQASSSDESESYTLRVGLRGRRGLGRLSLSPRKRERLSVSSPEPVDVLPVSPKCLEVEEVDCSFLSLGREGASVAQCTCRALRWRSMPYPEVTRCGCLALVRGQRRATGEVAWFRAPGALNKYVFYVLTKDADGDRAKPDDVESAFRELRDLCLELGVETLAMPRFSEAESWQMMLLITTLADVPMTLVICGPIKAPSSTPSTARSTDAEDAPSPPREADAHEFGKAKGWKKKRFPKRGGKMVSFNGGSDLRVTISVNDRLNIARNVEDGCDV